MSGNGSPRRRYAARSRRCTRCSSSTSSSGTSRSTSGSLTYGTRYELGIFHFEKKGGLSGPTIAMPFLQRQQVLRTRTRSSSRPRGVKCGLHEKIERKEVVDTKGGYEVRMPSTLCNCCLEMLQSTEELVCVCNEGTYGRSGKRIVGAMKTHLFFLLAFFSKRNS